jgi:hypothetical protein
VQTLFQIRISDAKAEAESYKSQLDDVKAHEAQLRVHIKVMTFRVLHSAPYLTVIPDTPRGTSQGAKFSCSA